MKECASDKQPLLHPVGIMPNVVLGSLEQVDLMKHLIDSYSIGTVESRGKSQILSSGHPFVEVLIFGNDSHQRLETSLFSRNVATSDSGSAGCGSQLAAQHSDRSRFTRSVMAQETKHLASFYREGD